MKDFLLVISFDDPVSEEIIQSRLFLTASTGSTSTEDQITAYFDSPDDRSVAKSLLADFDVSETERERVDWLELYQQSLEPMEIGSRFIVAPDASLLQGSTRLPIVVPQEQAFGTGSHETTALCIELLESIDIAGKRGLDIGTGSGILAIAMHHLGAAKVIAFDNDRDAYAAMRDNRMRNGVDESKMPMFIGGIESLRGGTFDVVTMNIIPEVIIPLLPEVVRHVGRALILSGILVVKRDEVVLAARENGLTLVTERSRGEWWAGWFVSSGDHRR
ncbi:MAG TPA: 50S ribosomal protein L11 methyltransferase [Thermoanaerobaculia bacterium]|nr:50S ribosomal protein L11 methyltransferase [Thermoanaerobaculia bacterium]